MEEEINEVINEDSNVIIEDTSSEQINTKKKKVIEFDSRLYFVLNISYILFVFISQPINNLFFNDTFTSNVINLKVELFIEYNILLLILLGLKKYYKKNKYFINFYYSISVFYFLAIFYCLSMDLYYVFYK